METRKRRQRNDTGPRLTDRDVLLLQIIGEQYALRFDQIQNVLGQYSKAENLQDGMLSPSATRHAITRWEHAGLVAYKKFFVDMAGFCWLTPEGLRTADLPFRKYEPSPPQLNHIYWSSQARLYLARRYPAWNWQSERWLRTHLDQKVKSVKLPDALVTLPDTRTIAIEVELTQKNAATLEQIVRDRTLVYMQIWYFTPPTIGKALLAAIRQLDENYRQRIKVYPLDKLTEM